MEKDWDGQCELKLSSISKHRALQTFGETIDLTNIMTTRGQIKNIYCTLQRGKTIFFAAQMTLNAIPNNPDENSDNQECFQNTTLSHHDNGEIM